MIDGKEFHELIEQSAKMEGKLAVWVAELRERIANSNDPQEKEVLGGLVKAAEKFLSLNLHEALLEHVPEEGNA